MNSVFRQASIGLCLVGFLVLRLHAEPVGGKVDPFLADRSPQGVAFREAVFKAHEEMAHLEPLPEGVSGVEQRKRVVEAFERAVAIKPDAPQVPGILLTIGQLWNSPAVAPEEPLKAADAYDRLIKRFPADHANVLRALSGLASAYCSGRDYQRSIDTCHRIIEYHLPVDADSALIQEFEEIRTFNRKLMAGMIAEQLRLSAENGQIHLAGAERSVEERVDDMDNPRHLAPVSQTPAIVAAAPAEVSNASDSRRWLITALATGVGGGILLVVLMRKRATKRAAGCPDAR